MKDTIGGNAVRGANAPREVRRRFREVSSEKGRKQKNKRGREGGRGERERERESQEGRMGG